jgi:hypothetical protein
MVQSQKLSLLREAARVLSSESVDSKTELFTALTNVTQVSPMVPG